MVEKRRSVLDAALAAVSEDSGFRAGICALGLEGPLAGWSVGVDEELALPSASLIKVFVLAGLLRQADLGFLSLDEAPVVRPEDLVEDSEMLEREELPAWVPVRRLAEGMITLSDNAATNLLSDESAWGGSRLSPATSACAAPACAGR